ncbi:hypothetical protein [Neobacillus novalis]|nr:hypothetical protein [Neobacillus novalis]
MTNIITYFPIGEFQYSIGEYAVPISEFMQSIGEYLYSISE